MTLGELLTSSVKLKNNIPSKSVPASGPHYGGATRDEWVQFKNRKTGTTGKVVGELSVSGLSMLGPGEVTTTLGPPDRVAPACFLPPQVPRHSLEYTSVAPQLEVT